MTSSDKGLCWLKCDLQVQTPEDSRHWLDDELRLQEPRRPKASGHPVEQDIQDKARRFLRRCYELKLDVIGITDHNFSAKTDPRDWFAVHLVEQNKTVAAEFNLPPLTIFPGFEVDIGYHLLCLFEPATKQVHFEKCNRILTKLGMAEDARFDNSGPRQLRHNNQTISLKKLLEIVQDEHRGIVIAAHADQNKGILEGPGNREDYKNPFLYCVELTQNPPAQKHKDILCGGSRDWTREQRQPAWIMSSDAKSIRAEDGKPVPNSLGYRYTWIKMSQPSIESLRQAFLDPESRILIPDKFEESAHPSKCIRHAKILSISIKNAAFLADQEVHFSPGMNCIIGGRGSGKSTLIEYLRLLFRKESSVPLDDDGTRARIQRVRETLNKPGAELEVEWVSADGVEERFVWKDGSSMVSGRELPDPDTYFNGLPVRFYSQQELNHLTESKVGEGSVRQAQRLLDLIDGFSRRELDDLAEQERKLMIQIREAFSRLRHASELESERARLQQEFQELDRQCKARQEIQPEALKYQYIKAESKYLEEIMGVPGKTFSDVLALTDAVVESHVPYQVEHSWYAQWFRQFDKEVEAAKKAVAEKIHDAIRGFGTTVEALKSSNPEWPTIQNEIDQADEIFRAACETKGLTPDDVGRLQELNELRSKKKAEIDEIGIQIANVKEAVDDPEFLVAKLHQIWLLQFQERQEAAEKANNMAQLSEGHRRFIEVSAAFQQERESFRRLWNGFAPLDGRTRLGKNWDDIGQDLYKQIVNQTEVASPWQLLQNWLSPNSGIHIPKCDEFRTELVQYVSESLEQWQNLRCSRVDDVVDMKLFRTDGTLAGSIADGSLSDGQRNTAALALLLAQKGGPLVIDQPEDELDSHFLYRELIPMLRKVKCNRQLIMSTHNANLPVNGDAELVYAFEATDNMGVMRVQGGLDQSQVTKAILDIMEGTEEAFRRRREKYNF